MTVLVVRDRTTRMTMASIVPTIGNGEFIARLVAFMRELGCEYGAVMIKADQEAATKAVVKEVCRHRAARGNDDTKVEDK